MRPIHRIMAVAALASAIPTIAVAADRQAASSIPEPGNPEARRERFNEQQAAVARQQLADNAASQQRYEAAVASAQMQADRQDSAYADTLRQHDTAVDTYRSDRKEWERTNPACWNGSAAECPAEPPVPSPGR
ncbi:hypothetical protein [Novosphingobium kaempferiae]|uniref:hypothetical protein n=1 Tax=Novosphingobium kaempferiae TaxID=2896849 RepID=UPI001E3E7C37|nr:hypothetical protein [Novosphingobium kaempferiae]